MTSGSKVYIAGVGSSPLSSRGASAEDGIKSLVSAATKALLDAGVTYDDVTQGVRSEKSKTFSYGAEVFKAFDERGISVDEVKSGSELESSFKLAKTKTIPCILMIAVEKSTAIAFVIVSDSFLWRHPYLKDSAARLDKTDAASSKSKEQEKSGLDELCRIVWALRGWSQPKSKADRKGPLYYKGASNQIFEISRADSKPVPEWKDVEHKQDGKHRLGYNPASETNEISQEDFEAVRAIRKERSKKDDKSRFERMGGDRAALAKL